MTACPMGTVQSLHTKDHEMRTRTQRAVPCRLYRLLLVALLCVLRFPMLPIWSARSLPARSTTESRPQETVQALYSVIHMRSSLLVFSRAEDKARLQAEQPLVNALAFLHALPSVTCTVNLLIYLPGPQTTAVHKVAV